MNKVDLTIVIADDHPLMLNGLKQELELEGYTVLGTAKNGAEAFELITEHQPHIAILDIEMPLLNAYQVMRQSNNHSMNTRFITMTYHRGKGYAVQAKKFGAQGYLLKEDRIEEINKCISAVMNGKTYYSSSFDSGISGLVNKEINKVSELTPSERKIICLIAQNKNSSQIGEELFISTRTVQKHRTNIIAKLELSPNPNSIIDWIREHKDLITML